MTQPVKLLIQAGDVPSGGFVSRPMFPSRVLGQLEKTYTVVSFGSTATVVHKALEGKLFHVSSDKDPALVDQNSEVVWYAHPRDAAHYLANLGKGKRLVCSPMYRVAYVIFKGELNYKETHLADHSPTHLEYPSYLVYVPENPKPFHLRNLTNGHDYAAFQTVDEAQYQRDVELASLIVAAMTNEGHKVYWARSDARAAAIALYKNKEQS